MVCNPLYTAYFTTARKDRLTIVDVLRNLDVRTFRVNAETIDLLRIFGVAQCTVRSVQGLPQDQDWREAEFTALLDARLPTLGPQQRVAHLGSRRRGRLPCPAGVPGRQAVALR